MTALPLATHSGYRKGCNCVRCDLWRQRSRETARKRRESGAEFASDRRVYKTQKQAEYDKRRRDARPPKSRPLPVKQQPDYNRNKRLWGSHRMRPADWQAMWDEQDGNCYLCGDPLPDGNDPWIAIDHDHTHCPGQRSCHLCRRGLAHDRCNKGIGFAQDDPAKVALWAANLEQAQAAVRERLAATAANSTPDATATGTELAGEAASRSVA